jgi:hypothetical protein
MISKHAFVLFLATGLGVFGGAIIGSNAGEQAIIHAEAIELGKLPPGGLAMSDGLISPDGSRWAAVVLGLRDAKKPPLPENMMAAVIVDGKADPWYTRVANLSFSRDGRSIIFRISV